MLYIESGLSSACCVTVYVTLQATLEISALLLKQRFFALMHIQLIDRFLFMFLLRCIQEEIFTFCFILLEIKFLNHLHVNIFRLL